MDLNRNRLPRGLSLFWKRYRSWKGKPCEFCSSRLKAKFCRFLWPNWNEDASNYHVLLIAMIVDVKLKEGLPVWGMSSSSFQGSRPNICQTISMIDLLNSRNSSAASSP
jgi:hypothetical protein